MEQAKIKELVKQMTLEEKASLCSGKDFWFTKGIERLGIPEVMVSDGPHGLRKQEQAGDHLGLNESIKAVCFPAGCATAASFDRELVYKLGETLGAECQAEAVSVILGPAMNIKRSPLCGRNFEYYSEDPLVSSEIGAAFIQGVQSKQVGACPKHFAANNQEYRRMTSSSDLDERTYREIYLAAFEGAIKKAKPWTIMNSYNRINGVYAGENKELLTEILRKEWGFDGYVMTDWGATNERVDALAAGCNLEMPGNGGLRDAEICEAVKNGTLSKEVLDKSVEEFLRIVFSYWENKKTETVWDQEADHAIARTIAEECMVLLKNEDAILPLRPEAKVAFIGKYAKTPRYQGGGSSHINSFRVENAWEEASRFAKVTYALGYKDEQDVVDQSLLEEAVKRAKEAEAAVIFAGLPDSFESEGYDRKHMQMPKNQNLLIEEIAKVQPNVIVVLHNGSPIEMPWRNRVKAIIETYLGGQAVGGAVANILYGKVNPCGRLPETFPKRLEDTPCYLTYGGERDHSVYEEGIYVGYRYYGSKKMEVAYPFGYGLSYTTFAYSNLTVEKTQLTDADTITVSVDVTNTGSMAGKEVIQLYVRKLGGEIRTPLRELRGFDKIYLEPQETKTVTFTLDHRAFAYWDICVHDWRVEEGAYTIEIGRNAELMEIEKEVFVQATKEIPVVYTMNTTIGDILKTTKGQMIFGQMMGQGAAADNAKQMEEASKEQDAMNAEMMAAMMSGMPLRQLCSFVPGMTKQMLQGILDALNA